MKPRAHAAIGGGCLFGQAVAYEVRGYGQGMPAEGRLAFIAEILKEDTSR